MANFKFTFFFLVFAVIMMQYYITGVPCVNVILHGRMIEYTMAAWEFFEYVTDGHNPFLLLGKGPQGE